MRSKVETYEDLEVWKRSMDLVEGIYRLTDEFPKTETYGLVAQMRGCAISIPSNIAEGKRRFGNREFRRFAGIAFGSGAELETQIKIAKRLQFVGIEKFCKVDKLLLGVMQMLNRLIRSLT